MHGRGRRLRRHRPGLPGSRWCGGGPSAARRRTATNEVNIWVLARENGPARFFGDVNAQLGPIGSLATIASIVSVVLAVLLVRSRWDDDAPMPALALPVFAYLLVSTYPSSWYIAWILPLLALRWRSRAMWIGIAVSFLLFVREHHYAAVSVVQNPFGVPGAPLDDRLLSALYPATIAVEVVGIVVLVVEALRRTGVISRSPR